jgi:hypothetical protein
MSGGFDAPPPLRDLAHRYALAVDRRDAALICGIFAADGEVAGFGENPISYRGPERLTEMMADLGMFERTMHKVYNQTFERDHAGAVSGLTYCTASHLLPGEEPTLLDMEIVYHDSFVEADGAWRFARRALEVLWVEFRPVKRFTPEIMSGSLGAFQ